MISYQELPRELVSPYLARYQEVEGLRIHSVEMDLESRTAEALLDVQRPLSEEFHLSQNNAYLALCQLIMAYTCVELGVDKDGIGQHTQFEQVSYNRRPILEKEGIRLKVQCVEHKESEKNGRTRVHAKWSYEVEDGSFEGHFDFFYILPGVKE